MSSTKIDTMLWNIQREIFNRPDETGRYRTIDESYLVMSPLEWYIATGRASVDFLNRLTNTRPCLIARDCIKGGSCEEVINRICKRIGYKREQ